MLKFLPNVVVGLACVGLVLFLGPGFVDMGQYQIIVSVAGILLLMCSIVFLAIMLSVSVAVSKPLTSRQTSRYNSPRSRYENK